MQRRVLLRRLGVVGAAALAGCASNGPSDGGAGTERTPTRPPRVTDTTFTVSNRQSGTQVDDATVRFGDERVVVDGTIWGVDGCTTAALTSAEYDDAADELTVAVATTRETDAEMCTQAIVEIDYEATVAFENGLPGRVVVTHDHGDGPREVAAVDR
ncbi:hypothetical protein [Haloarcula marina]|uniref:hypothetical protein n=1 Tax=Haloarcula marina TaxID=2961574 RepID=UPI0020B8FCD4|nr:hypothetical protein [Halomicroarcula marina]